MFADESLDCVEFKSSWKKERSLVESSAQTREVITDEIECQSVDRVEAEVQTDEQEIHNFHVIDDNSQELKNFLHKVEPYILKQLEKNVRSHAFDGYDVSWEQETAAVTSIHTLHHQAHNEQLQITSLSWNCTGSVVAASYGRFDHEDWCTHKSSLCTWNIDRRTVKSDKPDLAIDISSCLMCVQCHPKIPSLIAGGTFNGEVIIWDTNREDDLIVATSGIGDDSHKEPVSKVEWILDPDSKGKKYHVVSVSGDGKILTWKMTNKGSTLKLVEGQILLTESLPRDMKIQTKQKEMGVTCISYNHEDQSVFVIGSEMGGIFKCSAHTRGTPANSHIESSVPLNSPVTFTFSSHFGPVYSVDCSPYHRNLFLSCASDASARVYSMLQAYPIMSIEPGVGYLFSAKWSPVRPMVFAVTTESGDLLIYDLKVSTVTPVHKLQASPKKQPVYSMQFNHHQKHLLATGDALGYVQIWRLSGELTSQRQRETEQLAEIADTSVE